MSVTCVIVTIRIPSPKFVGLPVLKIGVILVITALSSLVSFTFYL